MASSINENDISAVTLSQFDDLSPAEHERLDAELEALDQSSATSKKRALTRRNAPRSGPILASPKVLRGERINGNTRSGIVAK
ncbi:hypothetical protein VCV18_012356 [Metarhizium anisopliae]